MKFEEVKDSGKPYKRHKWDEAISYVLETVGGEPFHLIMQEPNPLSEEELSAEDWYTLEDREQALAMVNDYTKKRVAEVMNDPLRRKRVERDIERMVNE